MNIVHRRICRSDSWATRMRSEVLPWACRDVPLDGDVLEIGPGYGITTRWLLEQGGRVTAVEVDPDLAGGLRNKFPDRVDVRLGDGADLPFEDATFDAVVCFTMLHHVPSPAQQDRLFTEAARVLRPGGVFAGSDSRLSLRFRLIHIGDTMVVVDPATLPDRLRTAGFADVLVDTSPRSLRFRAARPAPDGESGTMRS
jgi:SAM-dependent methyltransferase